MPVCKLSKLSKVNSQRKRHDLNVFVDAYAPDKDIVAVYAKLYAKQVLRYLKDVKHLKLTWCAQTVKVPFQNGQLFGFPDASWADDKSSRCSTLCYVLCCNGAVFSWKSALAPIFALSTSEAELISVASCAQEVNFCRKLAAELGFIQPGPAYATLVYSRGILRLAKLRSFAVHMQH
jgi:hypothetical protein